MAAADRAMFLFVPPVLCSPSLSAFFGLIDTFYNCIWLSITLVALLAVIRYGF